MGKKKETIEIPEKIGIGTRDCYIVSEATDTKITYLQQGKGDQDIIWVIEDIKKSDPNAEIVRGDKRVEINLSQSFKIETYKSPRKVIDLSDRETKRLNGIIVAIAESEIETEDYSDEDIEAQRQEFPKVVKYYTDEESEDYYIKSENELWLNEENFSRNANLLLVLTQSYLESRGLQRGTIEYQEKFEDIVANYV